jgi:hypothetical protein
MHTQHGLQAGCACVCPSGQGTRAPLEHACQPAPALSATVAEPVCCSDSQASTCKTATGVPPVTATNTGCRAPNHMLTNNTSISLLSAPRGWRPGGRGRLVGKQGLEAFILVLNWVGPAGLLLPPGKRVERKLECTDGRNSGGKWCGWLAGPAVLMSEISVHMHASGERQLKAPLLARETASVQVGTVRAGTQGGAAVHNGST